MSELKLIEMKDRPASDSMRIDKVKGNIKATVTFLKYRDKDTRQIVIYIPSMDVSGYGATDKKAKEMVKSSIQSFCEHLMTLQGGKIDTFLSKLGWKKKLYAKKQYSKAFVDKNGELKNFNAVGDEIEIGGAEVLA